MPVYEYLCSKGHEYEKTESFSAPSEQKCARCGAKARRKISRPAVIFKGSGFYSTDNRGSRGRDAHNDSPAPTTAASSNGHSHDSGSDAHDTSKIDASVD